MKAYVEFEILEGAYEISCPDALCPLQGIMNIENDIAALVSSELVKKHKHFRLNRGKSEFNREFTFYFLKQLFYYDLKKLLKSLFSFIFFYSK